MTCFRQKILVAFLALQCFVVLQLVVVFHIDSTKFDRRLISTSRSRRTNNGNREGYMVGSIRSSLEARQSNDTIDAPIQLETHQYHSSRSKQTKIMYFLHIHKAAGHSICHQAQHNGMIANFDWNCNVQEDQRCCGNEDSLDAQIRFATSTNYTFVAAEKEMYDAMATDYYDYIVVLRDSKDRYKSHWKHLQIDANTYPVAFTGDKSQDIVHDRYRIPINGIRYSVGNLTKWWQNQPDNYNLRMICGSRCLHTPKFQITPELLQYTLSRLQKFSFIMFVENLEQSFNAFTAQYGWKSSKSNELHQNAKLDNRTKYSHLPKEKAWDPFMSVLDDYLYDFARRIYGQKTRKKASFGPRINQNAVREYFLKGPLRQCTNPCCGECTIW